MEVLLESVSKRYDTEWVLRDIDLHIKSGERLAVLGANGSGKSTLVKIIAGYLSTSKGKVRHRQEGLDTPEEAVYSHISICAPYLSHYTDMNLSECLDLHYSLRQARPNTDIRATLSDLGLPFDRPMRGFSSGMMQRVSLALAMYTESSLVLLDEPSSNLDEPGIAWMNALIHELPEQVSLVVASNAPNIETQGCQRTVHISELQAS